MRIARVLRQALVVAIATAWPFVSSAAIVERIAPSIPAGPSGASAAGLPLGASLAPMSRGPLLAPAAPALAAVQAAAAQTPQPAAAAAPPFGPAASPVVEAARAEWKRQAALGYAQSILDGLMEHAAGRPDDSYARALPAEELGKLALMSLNKDNALRPLRAAAAALGGDEGTYKLVVQENIPPRKLERTLYRLGEGLRRTFEADLPAGPRVEVSRLLHSLTSELLARLARDPSLPDAARSVAAKAVRHVEDDRMLAALAWGRQEKARIAEGRRSVLAERVEDGQGKVAGTSAFDPSNGWHPPEADSAPPLKPGRGVAKWKISMDEIQREFQGDRELFELARARRDAASRLPLSRAGKTREARRWKKAVRSYAQALDFQENKVNRLLNNSVNRGFSQVDIRGRPIHEANHPGLSFREVEGGYRLEASFETEIDDPAMIAAFRRSIESYWTGRFQEDGRERTFETRVSVRVLAPGDAGSPNALDLYESGRTNSFAGANGIAMSRTFLFHVPAHEFGHVLGLPDEYVDEYLPEEMAVRYEQDRASLMANIKGLALSRHFAEVVRLLKAAQSGG